MTYDHKYTADGNYNSKSETSIGFQLVPIMRLVNLNMTLKVAI